ncbi:DUF6275 family protein [Sporolactobacillus shoreicorticis]|uniref:DUF6275 family protein n=1 Tax=Sporolactobacillus shoreicorticis TaxID=1923877 RepID=A0ABW5S5D9_9BACL|nr:DUF6275 family protein [Sporolactobacillus shoreicorticis]MCO7127834.1 DUF6275 family protein [Sporolactobacillus shoreicorticis]
MYDPKFISKAKAMVAEYTNEHMEVANGPTIEPKDVYVVWLAKTLQNAKALLATSLPDELYFEVTYNGDNEEYYFDAYKKIVNTRFGK